MVQGKKADFILALEFIYIALLYIEIWMGIRGLTKLISDNAPNAIKNVQSMDHYKGKIIAFDTSLHMYQIMTVLKTPAVSMETDGVDPMVILSGQGLLGLLSRVVRAMSAGIRPVFVFDGEPPTEKGPTLKKRSENREKVMVGGSSPDSNRFYKLTKSDIDDCKKMLRLAGIPIIQAPGEAEAQCADMCRNGIVHGVSTEDTDTLTFGSPLLIRNMFSSKSNITEYHLDALIRDLGLISQGQFVDLCILCGCDYCSTIPGIGPVRALSHIRSHENIEGVLGSVMTTSPHRPVELTHDAMQTFKYVKARKLFLEPKVLTMAEVVNMMEWLPPNEQGLQSFLINDKHMDRDQVGRYIKKLVTASKRLSSNHASSDSCTPVTMSTTPSPLSDQTRIDQFFRVRTSRPQQ